MVADLLSAGDEFHARENLHLAGRRLRYSGSSLGYQLASIIAGGPAPLIAICAVITLIATALMTGYTGKDISGEYRDEFGEYPAQGYQAGAPR